MSIEITSVNPVVKAIINGTAPRPAQLAAARGMLPLPQTDLLEILAALANTTVRIVLTSLRGIHNGGPVIKKRAFGGLLRHAAPPPCLVMFLEMFLGAGSGDVATPP